MDLLGRKAKRNASLIVKAYEHILRDREALLLEMADRLEKRNQAIKDLQVKLENSIPKPPAIRSEPLYLNETEEDIEYAYRNELINKAQYEDMLKQLEFDNTQITFDLEAY